MSTGALRAVLDRWAALGRFSGVAAVGMGGEVVFAGAWPPAGDALLRRFPLGSLSKVVTAVAVLQLESAGSIGLEDPISAHLPDLGPSWGDRVRIRHLLVHTSGIPSLLKPHAGTQVPDEELARPLSSPRELVERFARLPLRFDPGAHAEYCNSGYALLAVLVERVSGLPFGRYLERHVLGPAGATTAGLDPRPGDVRGRVGGQLAAEPHPTWLLGFGDLRGSALDLLRIGAALDAGALLGPGAMQRMTRELVPSPEGDIGLGWRRRKSGGRTVVFHDGVLAGVVGTWRRWSDPNRPVGGGFGPERGLRGGVPPGRHPAAQDGYRADGAISVVVLCDGVPGVAHIPVAGRTAGRVADELAAYAGGWEPEAPAPEYASDVPVQPYCGRYVLDPERSLDVRAGTGALYARTAGTSPWTLHGAACPQAEPLLRAATEALQDLLDGRYEAVRARMAAAGDTSIEDLRAVREAVMRGSGAAARLTPLLCADGAAFVACRVPGDAGRTVRRLDGRAAFDALGRIAGLSFSAPGELPAVRELRLLPVAPDAFVADGYPAGLDDLVVRFERLDGRVAALSVQGTGGGLVAQRQAPLDP